MKHHSLEIDRGSEKNFGITFAIVFSLIGIYRLWVSGEILLWAFAATGVMLVVTYTSPSLLKIPNYLWFKLGMLLGSVVAPIVMAIVYVTTVVPLGLFVRLSGKDILRLRLNRNSQSYWISRESPPQPMKNQF